MEAWIAESITEESRKLRLEAEKKLTADLDLLKTLDNDEIQS